MVSSRDVFSLASLSYSIYIEQSGRFSAAAILGIHILFITPPHNVSRLANSKVHPKIDQSTAAQFYFEGFGKFHRE